MGFIEDTRYKEFGARCIFFDRTGGVSPPPFESLNFSVSVGDKEENVNKNFEIVKKSINAKQIATVNQIHSNIIVKYMPDVTPEADGLYTDKRDVFLAIKTADCLPITLMDTKTKIIMALHAGWRGSYLKIVEKGVELLKTSGANPKEIIATIGPHICRNCYEIKMDVASKFPPKYINKKHGKLFLDLSSFNKDQLQYSGLPEENIVDIGICTFEDKNFFSYRRDGVCGRNIGGIMLIDT